ncbi:MAG: hypothetical protein NTX03_15140, partial [Bacteroidetes bacterium]|nr:hypothetical protein [Bacteroidota bacterium]
KATIYYEELLKRFPDSKYGLKAHYTLYNIYSSAGNEAAAKVHKDFILNNYPTSEYAILIKSPEMLLKKYKSKSAAVLNALYERTFIEYKKGNCARVAQMADSSNIIEQNNFLLAKFDYLKTLCSFRTDTAADASAKQIDSLNSFIKKYPGSDMSLEAIKLITLIQERPKESMVIKDTTQKVVRTVPYQKADSLTHMFVCVLPFEKVNINMVKAKFSDYNRENFGKENLELTSIVIDDNRQAIVVKNFVDIKRTQNYFSTVQRDKDFFSRMGLGEQKYFYISDQNFTLFMKDKDADIYLKFFNEKYK